MNDPQSELSQLLTVLNDEEVHRMRVRAKWHSFDALIALLDAEIQKREDLIRQSAKAK